MIRMSGIASNMDTESIVRDLMKIEQLKSDKVRKQKTKLEWKKDAWQDLNSKIYNFYKGSLFKFKSEGTYSASKILNSSDESTVKISAANGAANGSHQVTVNSLAKGSFLTGTELGNDRHGNDISSNTKAEDLIDFGGASTVKINLKSDKNAGFGVGNEIVIAKTDTIKDITNKMKDLGVDINVNFDDKFNRLFMSSTKTGQEIQIEVQGQDGNANNLLSALGIGAGNAQGSAGTNAEFVYNGATLSSDSNEVSINGLSLNLVSTGTAELTVGTDNKAIYNQVKEFVGEYNKLMDLMTEKVTANSAKGYEPLTSEEKKALSDDDIKLWETKVKSALLRRDPIINSVQSQMRGVLTSNVGVDTSSFKYKSLSDLGIVTGNYKERGKLHIQGDEDDAAYAGGTNKLMKAIEENPDDVKELLTALGDNLYKKMSDMMKSNASSSALTFYNDKQMNTEMKNYDRRMTLLEERYTRMEERYYKQFAAMEQAIQRANSQSQWMASQLGGFGM